MKLKDIQCRNAKPKEKAYKLADGGGMYLEISPKGSKYWRLKYRIHGKEKRLALGVYPAVSLSEAREKRDEAKKLIAGGTDPVSAKREAKAEATANAANTFKAVALEWHDTKKSGWSENYAYKMMKGLEKNVFPFIGDRPIKDITPPELLDKCLRQIEKRGSLDIASRTKQICAQVFRYAIQTGRCEWNAADNLQGALKTHKKEHYRTIDKKELPVFIGALKRNEARLFERTRRAVWLSLYTFQRPGEIRQMRWQDIDFDEALWSIPAETMKMKRPHLVPLPTQAIKLLEDQKTETGILNTEWVFPSQVKPRNPMSDGTVNKAIKRLGFGKEMVAHGFRALGRTTIREDLGYDSEVIEKHISHKSKGALGNAYDRTQFLEERIKMMQDWADYLDKLEG